MNQGDLSAFFQKIVREAKKEATMIDKATKF